MPRDNRKILSSVRVTGKPLFQDGMEDELAAELDQQRLDRLKLTGVLVGDWRSTKQGGGGINIVGDAPGGELSNRIASENMQVIGNQSKEFVPLSSDETLRRFQEFDFSDEVMRSMQFHKEAIKTKIGAAVGDDSETKDDSNKGFSPDLNSSNSESETDSSNASDSERDEEFPADFPARSKFIKANKTFNEVKTLTREQLIEIDQIAEKTADEVLAYFADPVK